MSSEHIEIIVHAEPDFKGVDKELDRIAKKAKKNVKIPDSSGGGGNGGKDKSWNSKNFKKRFKESASKYHSGSAAANKIGADGSDLDETQHGGYYNTLDKKISAAKDFFAKKKKKNGNGEEDTGESPTQGLTNPSSAKQFSIQKAELKIQSANLDKGGLGNLPGSGGGSSTDGSSVKGQTMSSAAGALPVVGAVFAVAGGILKTISAIGEQYHAAMQSQSATIGATGGYLGGGRGYFSNAELAQANVMRGRITGDSVFGKGNQIDSDTIQFASSQGKGISEVVRELETIRKESKNASLGYLRGGANATGFGELRQSEYISKLASISEGLRSKGYSGDISDYAKFSAGLGHGDGSKMDPTRKMVLAEQLSDQGRSGAFGGGIFGSLSMAESLKANGGDVFKAIRDSEKNPGKYMTSALSGLDGNTRGIIQKMSGGSFSEMSDMKFGYKGFGNDNSPIKAGYNKGLELDNLKKETFATDVGAEAAQVGYDLNKGMIDLFKENKEAMRGLTQVVGGIEKAVLPVVSTGISMIVSDLQTITGMFKDMAKFFSNPSGMLIRSK
ncbi:hypothetical protein LFX25_20695 [Leptospira sp. FAT2]|uniref:hypothetical protein n=1 Tax=Leptospira sanjuanensis TaxID=2879643 RepID=UPI001EE8127E|nr:hypothetical protein [Leptospira sanjuanensis]MCG6195665.1 hypothetical protein [Leptospira sanjuanensis]